MLVSCTLVVSVVIFALWDDRFISCHKNAILVSYNSLLMSLRIHMPHALYLFRAKMMVEHASNCSLLHVYICNACCLIFNTLSCSFDVIFCPCLDQRVFCTPRNYKTKETPLNGEQNKN